MHKYKLYHLLQRPTAQREQSSRSFQLRALLILGSDLDERTLLIIGVNEKDLRRGNSNPPSFNKGSLRGGGASKRSSFRSLWLSDRKKDLGYSPGDPHNREEEREGVKWSFHIQLYSITLRTQGELE